MGSSRGTRGDGVTPLVAWPRGMEAGRLPGSQW